MTTIPEIKAIDLARVCGGATQGEVPPIVACGEEHKATLDWLNKQPQPVGVYSAAQRKIAEAADTRLDACLNKARSVSDQYRQWLGT